MMKKFLIFFFSTVIGVVLAQETKPNVLWILCDDLGVQLPAYGDKTAKTPNIDMLTKDAVTYTNFFGVSGIGSVNRTASLTGMYPTSIGALHSHTDQHNLDHLPRYQVAMPPYVKFFTEYMRNNGYFASYSGDGEFQFENPISAWDTIGHKYLWELRAKDQPFISVVNMNHTSDKIVSNGIQEVNIDNVNIPSIFPNSETSKKLIASYYTQIELLDKEIGQFIEKLKSDGLYDSTIIILTGDNGAPFPRYHMSVYDDGIHLPMVIKHPKSVNAGAKSEELVSAIDLGPTILSMTNTHSVDNFHMQGKVFLGSKDKSSSRKFIYAAKDRIEDHEDRVRVVRSAKFKYIRNYEADKPYIRFNSPMYDDLIMMELIALAENGELPVDVKGWFADNKPEYELYDITSDPHELRNLATDPAYKSDLERLDKELKKWEHRSRDLGRFSEKEIAHKMWPAGVQPLTDPPHVFPKTYTFKDKLKLNLYCNTEGASVIYKIVGVHNTWQLFNKPFELKESATIQAVGIRYGYEKSVLSEFSFHKVDPQ